jgi:hypothetical protein
VRNVRHVLWKLAGTEVEIGKHTQHADLRKASFFPITKGKQTKYIRLRA